MDRRAGLVQQPGQRHRHVLLLRRAVDDALPAAATPDLRRGLDGMDPYLGWAYPGGVLSTFVSHWWNNSVRLANKFPANGSGPRDLDVDIPALSLAHPERDSFWAERSFRTELAGVTIPVYSIGNWAKRELHLGGNLRAFQLLAGPKKLKLLDLPSGAVALELFETAEFHREVLLPFYDHYLKGLDTSCLDRPEVEYTLAGNGGRHPPAGGRRRRSLMCRSA